MSEEGGPDVAMINQGFSGMGALVEAGLLLPLNDYCLLYTSDAADERSSVDLGGRRIIKKKNNIQHDAHEKLHKRRHMLMQDNNIENDIITAEEGI